MLVIINVGSSEEHNLMRINASFDAYQCQGKRMAQVSQLTDGQMHLDMKSIWSSIDRYMELHA